MADRQGIIIRFGAAIADFLTGKNRVKDELQDLERSTEDVGDSGETSSRKTADGMKDVTDATTKAKEAADDLGNSTDQAGNKGSDFIDLMKGGLLSVAGVAGGVAGIVQSVFGAAVDFIREKITDQQEAARKLREDLIAAYVDAGAAGDLYLQKAQIIAAANEVLADDGKRANATKEALAIGVDVLTYIRAQAGDYEALKVVVEATKRAEEERRTAAIDGSKSEQAAKLQDLKQLEQIRRENENLLATHEEGQKLAEQAIQISNDLSTAEQERIQKTRDADQERYEQAAANLDALAKKEVVVPVEVDTSGAEKSLAAWRRRFTTGNGARVTIVADVVDRYGRSVDG